MVQIQAHEVNPVLSESVRFSSGTLGGKLFSFSMDLLKRTRWKLGGAGSHLVTMKGGKKICPRTEPIQREKKYKAEVGR